MFDEMQIKVILIMINFYVFFLFFNKMFFSLDGMID